MDLKTARTAQKGKPSPYPSYTSLPKTFNPRQKMPAISLEKRSRSFKEVEKGLTEEMAVKEASRCLACGCPRRAAAKEYLYHPDRLRFPLKRIGEKGENKWEEISWEQALDEIAAKLKELKDKYGPETLFLTHGTARSTSWTGPRFMNLFGSPNAVSPGTICYGPSVGVAAAMIGWPIIYRGDATVEPDENGNWITKCVLLSGMDISQAYPRLWKTTHDAKAMGAKIIVIDPRYTATSELADIWLQLRPGTDAALLMSMINVIIENELYDKEFVHKWCYGFDKVKERAREYSPEKVERITWVPSDKIKEAAITYATNRPGTSVHGMGEEQLENSIEILQARLILSAIVGNIDAEGGDFITGLPAGQSTPVHAAGMELAHILPPEQKEKQIGSDRFKLLSHPGRELIWSFNKNMWSGQAQLRAFANYPLLVNAILTGEPYPVRAGISVFSNPMVQMTNSKHLYKAFKSLDLYVVKDFWLTPSAQIADYVLPTAAWIERPNAEPFGGSVELIAGEAGLPAIIPGKHEYWTEWEFFRGLGIRLGQEEHWKAKTLEEIYDERFSPLGMTLHEFMEKNDGLFFPKREYKKYEQMEGFATPTGKLELYSTIFENLGYDPLPRFEEPRESPFSTPELAQEYPLMLITGGRIRPYYHSEHRQIPSLRKRRPHPIVQINPTTARKSGIEDGDWVWIESPRGTIRMKCQHFEGIHPQVVHCEHSWWFPEMPGGEPWLRGVWESNVNVLTSDDPDRCNPRSGGWPLKTALCKISKCRTY
jgi:anaerobic selenocysteine-containing dehydrogenase